MKREDITKIFEGATDEQVSAVLNINSADIGKVKSKLEAERDTYKNQLNDATTQLKAFEGVDVTELQGKVTTLNQQLANQKAAFDKQLADRDFDDLLNGAITRSKAKNVKAVRSQLDIEALRESKNQGEDIEAAIAKVKEESDYLFEPSEPIDQATFVDSTNGKTPSVKTNDELDKMSFAEYRKYRKEN